MQIRVLGEIELWRDGQRLDAVVGKQRALLAVLLASPELTASQDLLTDQLWPDRDPEAGLVSLHTCVYRLRKLLGNSTTRLHRQGDGYRLELGSDEVDLHRFEQLADSGRQALARGDHELAAQHLRAALALWRGEAMGGIDIAVVQEYARVLDEARLDVTEWSLTADLALDRQDEVSRETERLITRFPFRERFWELSMLALVRAGRQSAALQRYRELYRQLDDELGIQPSPSVQKLHQQILDGDQGVISELPEGLTGRMTVAVPRQLPPPLGRLAGREAELAQLSRPDPRTGPVITVITGQAGIGKSTLALSWAHSVADQFPDGQLYVNLLGFDAAGRIRTVGEVVRMFLISLGIDDRQLPRNTDDQLALFRTLTTDRRLLVVLDNARNADQVRPLLPPGSSCRVVITSRDRLAALIAIEGADSVPLDLLDAEACEQLLTGRIGVERIAADRTSAAKIIESCGRLPLALALAAAQVASRPKLSLAEAVRSIFDPRRGLDALEIGDAGASLRQVFSWSYSTVDPAAARLFRLLGVHPGPDLSAAAAASLAAVEPGEALRLLDRLTTANLLTEHLPARYLLHDLLRDYAAELARAVDGPEEVDRAGHRILDHYLQTAHAGAMAYDPARTPITLPAPVPGVTPELLQAAELMDWARREHGVLRSVVAWGKQLRADRHVWCLVWSLRAYLATMRPPLPDLPFELAAMECAQRLGDREGEVEARRFLISSYSLLGRPRQGLEQADLALRLANELDSPRHRAEVLRSLAFLRQNDGDVDLATDLLRQALHWHRIWGHEPATAKTLNLLGFFEAERGNGAVAIPLCREAITLFERHADPAEPDAWDSLGLACRVTGDPTTSAESYRRAIELYHRSGFHHSAGHSWVALADLQEEYDQPEAALTSLREALTVFREFAWQEAEKIHRRLIRTMTSRGAAAPDRAS